jgi:uncharacterized protein YndB with AHSA1/START domain
LLGHFELTRPLAAGTGSSSPQPTGAVAQLGERRVRNAEVRGSIPLCSTDMTGDLHIDRRVSASSSELWEACATPRGLEGWYADKVTGTITSGGSVRLEWPALRSSAPLEVVELLPERRVVYRNGASRVVLEVADERVALTHSGLTAKDDIEGFRSSWRVALAVLAHSMEVHRGLSRKASWFLARARTSARIAHLYFTAPEGLSAWLARGSGVAREGEAYSMTTLDGAPMSGRVLAAEGGRDVALSWYEANDSVVVFRSLPSPTHRDERILAACWSQWTAPSSQSDDGLGELGSKRIEAELERSVRRLARELDRGGVA